LIGLIAFLIPLTLFLGIPSTLWNFDGVACATALELGDPFYLFHANHLFYGWLGFLFWKFVGLPLGITRALPALQLFTSLLAAAGLVGLYRLVAPIVNSRLSALLLSCAMGCTAAFWVWSVEAQVFSLGFLALAWAAWALVHYRGPLKYAWVGLLHGAAILGHVLHALWAVPALYWLWKDCGESPDARSKALWQYGSVLAAMTLVPYAWVIAGVIAPGRRWGRIFFWLKGSAAITPDRHFAWHSVGWTGPWMWLKSTAPVIWGSFWPYGGTVVSPWIWIVTAISVMVFVSLMVQAWRQAVTPTQVVLVRFSLLWLGTYGLFLSTWEPGQLAYRTADVLPLGILLAEGLVRFKEPVRPLLIGFLLASLLTINLQTRIRPMHRPQQNAAYQEALHLSRITSPRSLYLTGGGLSWIYLLYFTGSTAWNARTFNAGALSSEVARLKRERPVYMQSGLLNDPAVADAVEGFRLTKLEQDPLWLQIQ